jgi:hypothetical protein
LRERSTGEAQRSRSGEGGQELGAALTRLE